MCQGQAARQAAWEALEGSPGSKMIRESNPGLEKVYRADALGFVVMQDADVGSVFRFELSHTNSEDRWVAK